MKMSLFFLVVEHVLVVEPVETPFRFDRLSEPISSGGEVKMKVGEIASSQPDGHQSVFSQ